MLQDDMPPHQTYRKKTTSAVSNNDGAEHVDCYSSAIEKWFLYTNKTASCFVEFCSASRNVGKQVMREQIAWACDVV